MVPHERLFAPQEDRNVSRDCTEQTETEDRASFFALVVRDVGRKFFVAPVVRSSEQNILSPRLSLSQREGPWCRRSWGSRGRSVLRYASNKPSGLFDPHPCARAGAFCATRLRRTFGIAARSGARALRSVGPFRLPAGKRNKRKAPPPARRMNPPRKVGARSLLPGFRINGCESPFHSLS